MALKNISLENVTVFDKVKIDFCNGINVFIGENGTGKTHVMKLLYAACQAAQAKATNIDFPQKIVRLFRPDDFNIGRLVSRKVGNVNAIIEVKTDDAFLKLKFQRGTKPKRPEPTGAQNWERRGADMVSTFIPAKEILSNSRNLVQARRLIKEI